MLNILSFGIPKNSPNNCATNLHDAHWLSIGCRYILRLRAESVIWQCSAARCSIHFHLVFLFRVLLVGGGAPPRSCQLILHLTLMQDSYHSRLLHPSNSQPTPHPGVCSPIHTSSLPQPTSNHPPLLILTLDLHFFLPPQPPVSHGGTVGPRVSLAELGTTVQRTCVPLSVWGGGSDVHAGRLRCCWEALPRLGTLLSWGTVLPDVAMLVCLYQLLVQYLL